MANNNVVPFSTGSTTPGGVYSGDRPTGGSEPPDMEARVRALEVHIDHIRSTLTDVKADVRDHRKDTTRDFRILFGALITAALGLAALMAKGFGWL